jgi:CDP-diacylglycerol---serine O-phosphatidyltransferase
MAFIKRYIAERHDGFKKKRRIFLSRQSFKKSLHILPNLFTLGNAFFGFCSIIFSAQADYVAAAYFILLGALMDALDGRIARFVDVTSEFGMQLDSLSDAISFGLAPAMLIYLWQLKKIGGLGLFACALFLMAGILRLARFNITHSKQFVCFTGTPITIAGCFLAIVLLNTKNMFFNSYKVILLFSLVVIMSMLMVSKIPFPSLKKLPKKIIPFAIICMLFPFCT